MSQASTRPIIFLAFANDRDDRARYLRNLAEEARRLREALEPAERAGLCEVVVRQNATVREIFDFFQDAQVRNRVAVFHYGGHANSYQLLFEGAEGQPAPADAASLAAFLGHQRGRRLAFLNGCSTQHQAQGLLDAGVAVVVTTSQAIDDQVATEFAARFYTGLAGGASIGTAFGEAQAALRTAEGGLTRHIGAVAEDGRPADDRLPWKRHIRPGAEAALDWSLPEAANDPLFPLPPLPKLDLPTTPYRHLEWFRQKDAEIFFGRGHEIAELYRRVTAADGSPIILFYGQSGVGKSSVLAAGLLPRLEGSYLVRYCRRSQTGDLSSSLVDALAASDASLLADAWRSAEVAASKPLVVVLDQVEELFTRPNPELPNELEHFLDMLASLFADPTRRPQGRLILGFRKEWLAEIEKRLEERRLPRARVFLERLSRPGIVEAVEGPARVPRLRDHYGLQVAPDLPGLIAGKLLEDRESPVAPMLQILLTAMWETAKARNDDHPTFDQALYQEFSRKGLGLNDFLTRQLQELRGKRAATVDSGLALDLLAYHTTPLGTSEQRAMSELEQTYRHQAGTLPGLVQECRDLYLLVDPSQSQPNQPAASRLTHDTLAPHVRKRFDESDAPGQRARRILESRAVDWEKGREGTPLDDADLTLVEAGLDGMRRRQEDEDRLVQASIAARNQREEERRSIKAEREEAQRQEQAEREARAAADARAEQQAKAAVTLRRRAWWLAAAATLAVILALVAGWFYSQANKASKTAVAAQGQAEANERQAQVAKETAVAAKLDADRARSQSEYLSRQVRSLQLASEARNAIAQHPYDPSLALILARAAVSTTWGTDGYVLPQVYDTVLGVIDAAPTLVMNLLHARSDVPTACTLTVEWSPSGDRIVTAGDDGLAKVWDTQKGEETLTLEGHRGGINKVAWSPDGSRILTAGDDGTARVWDAENGVEVLKLEVQNEAIFSAAWSPDQSRIVTADAGGDVRVWNVGNGSTIFSLTGHSCDTRYCPATSASYSPNGARIVSTGADGTARLWNATTGQADIVIAGDGSNKSEPYFAGLRSAAFSPNGEHIVTVGSYGTARVWNAQSGKEALKLSGYEAWTETADWSSAAWSSDGTRLVTASFDRIVVVWDASTGASEAILGAGTPICSVAWSPDGQRLAAADGDGYVRIWNAPATPPSLDTALSLVLKGVDSAGSVAWSPDGKRLVTGGQHGEVVVWEAQNGNVVWRREADETRIWSVTWSPDGTNVVTAGEDMTARVWNAENGEKTLTRSNPVSALASVSWSPNGALILTAGSDGTASAWNAKDGKERFVLPGGPGVVWSARWSPDGTRIVTAHSDNTAIVWSVSNAQPLVTLRGHSGPVNSASWSPDGAYIVTASDDRTAIVWDSQSGRRELTLPGHGEEVYEAAYSPVGDRIMTACNDGAVRLWDAHNGKQILTIQNPGMVWAAAWSPDGKYIAASSPSETRLWYVQPETLAARIGTLITRQPPEFTPDERQRYGLEPRQ